MVRRRDVEGLLCAGVECRRDSASLQRNRGKEDECGGEKNAGGVEKLFESEEFVENFTYEGDDLGVSVKKSRECDGNWQMPKRMNSL